MPWVSQLMFLLAVREEDMTSTQIRQVRQLLNEAVKLLTEDKKEDLN